MAFAEGLIDEVPNRDDALTDEDIQEYKEKYEAFVKPMTDLQLDRAIEKVEKMTDDELFDSMFDFVGSDGRGKYDGIPLKKEVTGITLDDIHKYCQRFTEEHRLILAAMLFNSCTPGRTDFTTFTDMVNFKPGLNPEAKKQRR